MQPSSHRENSRALGRGAVLCAFSVVSATLLIFIWACAGGGGGGGGLPLPTGPVALSVTTPSLPNATIGISYSQNLAATGGTSPYSWTIASGTLPAGITLSSSGTIAGTPTTAETRTFTVQVMDANTATAVSTTFTVTVSAAGSVTVTTTTLVNATVNQSYSKALAATGGTSPYTWTIASGTLPAGLALSTSGTISGTPTATGTSNFTVQATDAASATATQALAITVNAAGGTIAYLAIEPKINNGNGDMNWDVATNTLWIAKGDTQHVTIESPYRLSFFARDTNNNVIASSFMPNSSLSISWSIADPSVAFYASGSQASDQYPYLEALVDALDTGSASEPSTTVTLMVDGVAAQNTVTIKTVIGLEGNWTFTGDLGNGTYALTQTGNKFDWSISGHQTGTLTVKSLAWSSGGYDYTANVFSRTSLNQGVSTNKTTGATQSFTVAKQ